MDKKLFCNTVAQYKAKSVSGIDSIEWSGGTHCYLPSLKFYGGCSQYGTPTPDAPINIYSNTGTYVLKSDGRYIYLPDLRGIGEYRDEWNYVTGKGLRYIHKVELDGVSEYGRVNTSYLGAPGVICCAFKREFHVSRNGGGCFMSTHFKGSWNNSAVGCVFTTNMNSKENTYFTLDSDRYPDIASANAWLAEEYANGTPITVYYALAEPIPFEERHEWDVYEPVSNESGNVFWGDGNISSIPIEVTYITHS